MKFGVFVITRERSKETTTEKVLRNSGYTGDVFTVIDDTDSEIDEYKSMFDNVLVFSHKEWCDNTDYFNPNTYPHTSTCARNFVLDYAKRNDYDYILLSDDDMKRLLYVSDNGSKLIRTPIKNFDKLIDCVCEFMTNTNFKVFSFTLDDNYYGGYKGQEYQNKFTNRIAQHFILKVKDAKPFIGELNQDLNYSLQYSNVGDIMMSCAHISFVAPHRGTNKGGTQPVYNKRSLYEKNMYTLVTRPDVIRYNEEGKFKYSSKKFYPKIIDEKYRKR